MTKITHCGLSDDPPARWLSFLQDVTAQNQELIDFLQRVAGYALTGSVREHALFFFYGTGRNGKGTFLETLVSMLGDYAAVASMETFIDTHNDRHPTELAMLQGKRLVIAEEVEEGGRWAGNQS